MPIVGAKLVFVHKIFIYYNNNYDTIFYFNLPTMDNMKNLYYSDIVLFQEKELKRQQAYEEFLKEKLMIDEIVRKIYEEDQR